MSNIQLPKTEYVLLSIPEPHVLLITINREKKFNALHFPANWEMHNVINWAEEEDSIWCIIITGSGNRAFCAGMDLVSAHESRKADPNNSAKAELPPTGFAGISDRRMSRKPVVAAVNGFALGGGMEVVVSCNYVVATEKSKFGLPEVKQGVVIGAGGLPRLARSVSYQVASDLVLTGRFMGAKEAKHHGLVNEIIPNDGNVVEAALRWAKQVTANSPDAVFLTKQGLLLSIERASVTNVTEEWLSSHEAEVWRKGENLTEGLKAFAEKRKPQWKNPSKL